MFDPQIFQANQAAIPFERMLPLDAKCVAWSFDGTTPLAVAGNWADLYAEVDRLGLKDYVAAFVDLSPIRVGGLRFEAGAAPLEELTRAG